MKKTVDIEQALLDEAREACGAGTETDTIRRECDPALLSPAPVIKPS